MRNTMPTTTRIQKIKEKIPPNHPIPHPYIMSGPICQSLYLSPWAKISVHPQNGKTMPAAKTTFLLNSIFYASLFQMIRYHRIATAGGCFEINVLGSNYILVVSIYAIHFATTPFMPPEMSVAKLAKICGNARPPVEARYLGRHWGSNFSLYCRSPWKL